MELRRLVTVGVGLVALGGAGLLVGAGQDKGGAGESTLERQLNEALKTRAETAQVAFEAVAAAFEAETVTFDMLAEAIEKLAEAEVAVATKPGEVIAARHRQVERSKGVEAKIKALYDAGARGGQPKDYFSARRDRETAEILLLKARIQAPQ
jgi:hypothetical protein